MEEIFGGSKIPAAGKMTPEQQESYAGHQAYAVFAAQENMEKLLKEQGMWDLYRNVEIPLVFTLRQMEADGIAAEKALSVYGAELAERIGELEAQIYEEAGEEFNINSPKQLGVILFEKLQLPGGKKRPRRVIPLPPMCSKSSHRITNLLPIFWSTASLPN